MIDRLALAAAILTLSLAVGCGDDDGTTGDGGMVGIDANVDGGPITCMPPDMAPMPEGMTGACCYRVSNADRLDAPEMRLAGIRVTQPTPLNNVVIQQLLRDALDAELFNWIFESTITGTDISVRTGYGERSADGTFSFVMGVAPGPGDADRWDPVTAMGTITGEIVTTMPVSETLTVPVLEEGTTTVVTELPLRGLTLEMATLSEDRSCIGTRGPAAYRTGDGMLTAFIDVEESKSVLIDTEALMATLCDLLRGQATEGTNCVEPQDTWTVPPDSTCDATGCTAGGCTPTTCNAWQVRAEFAAHGVEITP